MSDVTLSEALVSLKALVDAHDERFEREAMAAERNVLQALLSRTERLSRVLRDARREDDAIRAAIAVAEVRIEATMGVAPARQTLPTRPVQLAARVVERPLADDAKEPRIRRIDIDP